MHNLFMLHPACIAACNFLFVTIVDIHMLIPDVFGCLYYTVDYKLPCANKI